MFKNVSLKLIASPQRGRLYAHRGRAYKSREDRTAIKLRLGKANLVRFWDKTASQVLG